MKRIVLWALLALALVPAACDQKRGMEARSYALTRLSNEEAMALITPYVREGGYISGKGKLISVMERPDRQELIARVLKQYDGGQEAVDIALQVQVIRADGFQGKDTAIADVEGTLRQLFRYRGYQLLGSTRIQTREDEDFLQATPQFTVSGRVQRLQPAGAERRVALTVRLESGSSRMMSTVTATLGKPVVLGQADAAGGAIILVLRPSIAS